MEAKMNRNQDRGSKDTNTYHAARTRGQDSRSQTIFSRDSKC
jgi:hypothetical protein